MIEHLVNIHIIFIGRGEKHEHIVPVLVRVMENIFKYSIKHKKKHLLRSDGLLQNKEVGVKVMSVLKSKYGTKFISNDGYHYNFVWWYQHNLLVVCKY